VARLALSIALSDNPNTRPLIDGAVAPEGISLTTTVIHPSEMFWRQLRFAEFDVSEMSMSSLLISTVRGPTPWVALPVFATREFFHTRILVRADAGISSPADLKGKRVGVPEYQQTAAIWGRGVLENEFGVRPRDMEFFMERVADKSHGGATGFKPPAGVTVHQIPASTNIGEMLVSGELDATLLYITHRNLVDRSRIDLSVDKRVRPSRPRRRGPPLLCKDRHLSDQPYRGDPPDAGGTASLDRVESIFRVRSGPRRSAARRKCGAGLPFRDRGHRRGRAQGAYHRPDGLWGEGDAQGPGDDRGLCACPGADGPAGQDRGAVCARDVGFVRALSLPSSVRTHRGVALTRRLARPNRRITLR
jgi:hypothetical protein